VAPSSLLGEERAKSRDHRLPLLRIPFPLFLSLSFSSLLLPSLALSLSLSLSLQLAVRRLTPSFLLVLFIQNDSTSSILKRSRARQHLARACVRTCRPVSRNPSSFVKSPRDRRGCDCIDRRRREREIFPRTGYRSSSYVRVNDA